MGLIYSTQVPNYGKKGAPILFIGESPGETEEQLLQPFVGSSGNILTECLLRCGLSREDVYLANLSQFRPQNNKFEFLENSWQLEEGKKEIDEYIRIYRPAVIVPLGNHPLEFVTGKKGISKYRGSILQTTNFGDTPIKVIPTFHPSYIQRNREEYPIFAADIDRIKNDAEFNDTRYRTRNYYIIEQGVELEEWTDRLIESRILACDIESIKSTHHIICVGFAPSPECAVCIPWNDYTVQYIRRILEADNEKIFHFGTYDTTVLSLNGITVKNYTHDTMAMQHALEPELPRGLDFLTSIHTREPYYKEEGRGELPTDTKAWSTKSNKSDIYVYNCKDCAVTFEIYESLLKDFDEDTMYTYKHSMEMIPIAQNISMNGLMIDEERRELLKKALFQEWAIKQHLLDKIAGYRINVNAKQKLYDFLYREMNLPVRKKDGKETAKEEALVSLIAFCKEKIATLTRQSSIVDWSIKLEALNLILKIRGIRKSISSYIKVKCTHGDRVCCTYKVTSTETGRWACEKFVDKTGLNAQTLPRGVVTVPDEFKDVINLHELYKESDEDEPDE